MPIALLAVVSVLSLAARAAWLSDPCADPCRGPAAHSLIFDEVYYVNAARRIDGLAVPAKQSYASDPKSRLPIRHANGPSPNSLMAPAMKSLTNCGCSELESCPAGSLA